MDQNLGIKESKKKINDNIARIKLFELAATTKNPKSVKISYHDRIDCIS